MSYFNSASTSSNSSIQTKEKSKQLFKGQIVSFEFEEDPSGQSIATIVKPHSEKQI